jgi:hypothetical protein
VAPGQAFSENFGGKKKSTVRAVELLKKKDLKAGDDITLVQIYVVGHYPSSCLYLKTPSC